MPRFYRSRAVALRLVVLPFFSPKCIIIIIMGTRLILFDKCLYSELAKYEELLMKALAQLEIIRAVSERVKNNLEAERAMSSILKTQLELVNECVSATVEIAFTEGYREGFEEAFKSSFKEKHPDTDIPNFELHDFPWSPELLKELEDLKEKSRVLIQGF